MRTLRVNGTATGLELVEGESPQPQPGPAELLIRVYAAGVTPSELRWYPTLHDRTGGERANAVPGHEFSGVVAGVGKEVGSLETGHEVFGMNDWFADGAMADYCVAAYSSVAPKPPRLTHVEAASVPIAGLTAWQGLFDRAALQPGERVLVHGGAGAVGVFAVQLARFRGAQVTATASARDLEFVRSLGADQVLDYRTASFENDVREVDVVFDTVGGETLQRSWSVLNPRGRMVTIAANSEGATDERTKRAFFIVEPNQKELAEIGSLLVAGGLVPVVDSVIPLSRAPEAFAGRIERRGCGRVVVSMVAEAADEYARSGQRIAGAMGAAGSPA